MTATSGAGSPGDGPNYPADAWAQVACDALATVYPYLPGHIVTGPQDVDVRPQALHPAFWGCLDWHSSVHMQASLLVLLAGGQCSEPVAARCRELLDARLTRAAIEVEVEYLRLRPSFERPYGWGWALMLAAQARGTRWEAPLAPLTQRIVELVPAWLAQPLPVRHGVHTNSAFALTLVLRAAAALHLPELTQLARARAIDWFEADGPADTSAEPSGHDFLSPALTQAALMMRVLPQADRPGWLSGYLPGLGEGAHRHLLAPPLTQDTSDGQLAHLLGLSLSRAWQLRELAPYLPEPARAAVLAAAEAMIEAVASVVTDGDFMSTHWLVTFALFAHLAGPPQ